MRTIDRSNLDTFQQAHNQYRFTETFPHGKNSHRSTSLVDEKHVHHDSRPQREGGREQAIEDPSGNELVEGLCVSRTEY